MTSRQTVHWDGSNGFTATYTNGRKNAMTNETLNFDAAGNIVYSAPYAPDPHSYQETTFDAAGRRVAFNGKTKGRQGGWLNYVSEDKTEHIADGEGRPVIEKSAHRTYHINNVPTTSLTAVVTGYQIWSTVLGNALTTLAPAGTKLETNVYAGGALIAKQKRYTEGSTNYDSIDWSTADPVTGTVGKYSYSSSGSATATENTEPLGQTLHPHDPADYTQPGSSSFIGNADDPHWQCEEKNASWLYGEFHKWPIGCQMRHMTEMWVTTYDYSKTDKPENPGNVTRRSLDSPLQGPQSGATYAANAVRKFAITSTVKKDGRGDGCDWDKHGRPECTVQSERASLIDMSDSGGLDASVSAVSV